MLQVTLTDKRHMTVPEKAKRIERLERHGIDRRRITACMRGRTLSFDGAILFLEQWLLKEANKKALYN